MELEEQLYAAVLGAEERRMALQRAFMEYTTALDLVASLELLVLGPEQPVSTWREIEQFLKPEHVALILESSLVMT